MAKYAFVVVVIIAAYFAFFNDPYPKSIVFNGVELGSRQDNNNSLQKDVAIFSYRDKTNRHVLLFAFLNETSAVTIQGLSAQYLQRFKEQGLAFKQGGSRFLGTKEGISMYMTEAKKLNALIVYTQMGGSTPASISDASGMFSELENYSF